MEENISLVIFYESLSDAEKRCLNAILELEEERLNLGTRTESRMFSDIKKIIEGEIK